MDKTYLLFLILLVELFLNFRFHIYFYYYAFGDIFSIGFGFREFLSLIRFEILDKKHKSSVGIKQKDLI